MTSKKNGVTQMTNMPHQLMISTFSASAMRECDGIRRIPAIFVARLRMCALGTSAKYSLAHLWEAMPLFFMEASSLMLSWHLDLKV
jgi:hypothetical protein